MTWWILIPLWLCSGKVELVEIDGNSTTTTTTTTAMATDTTTTTTTTTTSTSTEEKTTTLAAAPKDAPTRIRFSFDPAQVIVHFIPSKQRKNTGEIKGCEAYICEAPTISKKCQRKQTPKHRTSASFPKLKRSQTYYVTVLCHSQAGKSPHSPWILLIAPSASKEIVPERIERHGSGIEVLLVVDDGLNLELSWSFSFTNGSNFPIEYVKSVDVYAYKKPKDGMYGSRKVKSTGRNDKIRLGLSPSFTFDTGCHFYAVNTTFIDNSILFYSTEETCYSHTSAGFVILYIVITVLVLVAIIAITTSARTQKYAANTASAKPSKSHPRQSSMRYKGSRQRTPGAHRR
ncbi:hypothetical protein RB195_007536 [Necator americanus]|uniref:Fibronectin type-III domain-containing protein n=1 Tax=Necator americanus TaxID=51031 RepID=A0ABR1BXU1_NECAM